MQNHQQIEMSHDQISELIEGQKALKKSNEQLSTYIIQLKTLISGNELDKDDRGMIGELRETKLKVEALEVDTAKIKADKKGDRKYLAGFAFATMISWAVIQLIVNYFSNHQH